MNSRENIEFFENLARLVTLEPSLGKGLTRLGLETSSKKVAKVFEEVARKIEEGAGVSAALSMAAPQIPLIYQQIILIGEKSNRLPQMLDFIVRFATFRYRLETQIANAFRYHFVVLILSLLVVRMSAYWIYPIWEVWFREWGGSPPLLARFVHAFSKFPFITVFAGLFLYAKFGRKRRKLLYWLVVTCERIPVFGKVFRDSRHARFCFLLSTVLQSGLPLDQAIELVEEVDGKGLTCHLVSQGQTLSMAMRESGNFDEEFIELTAVAEEKGSLEGFLKKMASFYELEVELSVPVFGNRLHYVLIGLVGIIQLILTLGICLPYLTHMAG